MENKMLRLMFILLLSLAPLMSKSAELHVGKNKQFKTLKAAVESSRNGDKIVIHEGLYKENKILINKSIQIVGYKNSIFDAEYKTGNLFQVEADRFSISGITFRNVPSDYVSDNSAIKVINGKHGEIKGNKFEDCFFGIYLSNCSGITISNNTIIGIVKTETSSGNGVHLWKCRDISILNNEIMKHRDGIYFEFVKQSYIKDNLCKLNLRYGLHFMYSDSCSYVHNKFTNNGAGVAVMYTRNILMMNNQFSKNWGPTSYGILLKDISRSSIINNKFENNTSGIYAEGASRILIKENTFVENGWAFRMMGNCSDNTIIKNNFIANTFELSTNTMSNFNSISGNYWSKYKGYDLNKDKTGDIPYYPVSLFSKTIERSKESIILMNSFFIEILETAEKYIPSVIPKKVKDSKPAMEKINVNI